MMEEKILFDECVDALKLDAVVLSKEKSDKLSEILYKTAPFVWRRIDWDRVKYKAVIYDLNEAVHILEKLLEKPVDKTIYLLWDEITLLSIKTNLERALEKFNDVECVRYETFFYNPTQGYVIEYRKHDYLMVGLVTPQEIDFI